MRGSVTPNAGLDGPPAYHDLLRRFGAKDARIAIMGLGYVGFPLAIAVHRAGFSVLAYDIDAKKIDNLNKGKSYLRGIPDSEISDFLAKGRFQASTDPAILASADVIVICVPTPLSQENEPDLSYVCSTVETIVRSLRPGQLVVLESTTYPGTTTDLVKPALEASGLVCGRDIFLAYSPEREDPGNGFFSTHTIPKVVGADDPLSKSLAVALYNAITVEAVPVASSATAEAIKLFENSFRSVNIALVNEMKMVCAAMGIDIWEVIAAARTKPFGFMPFYPGPGVGGHCIPIDPFYLAWKARAYGVATPLIEQAGAINQGMPDYVIARLLDALTKQGKQGLAGRRILLLGIAYKAGVDDMRESPALVIFEALQKAGARVDYHDPFIAEIMPVRDHPSLAGIRSIELSKERLSQYDAALVISGHQEIDYEQVVAQCALVVDTRNVITASYSHVVQA